MRIASIDCLRMGAAIAVVLFHGLFRGPVSGWVQSARFPLLEEPAKYGLLGVDLFFIISGFVIAWSARDRGAIAFARARVLRLWPGFLACMTLSAVILAMAGHPLFPSTAAMWLANVLFMPQVFGQPFVDGAYWSIVLEIIFYGWVAVMIGTGLWPRHFALVGVAWLTLSVLNQAFLHSKALERLFLTGYAGEFLGGMILYRLHAGLRTPADIPLLVAAIATAVWFGITKTELEMQDFFHTTSNPAIVAALLLLAFYLVARASRAEVPPRVLRLATIVGSVTFPLYLLHQNVTYVLLDRAVPAGLPPAVALLGITLGIGAVALGVALWVEPAGRRLLATVWPEPGPPARTSPQPAAALPGRNAAASP